MFLAGSRGSFWGVCPLGGALLTFASSVCIKRCLSRVCLHFDMCVMTCGGSGGYKVPVNILVRCLFGHMFYELRVACCTGTSPEQ